MKPMKRIAAGTLFATLLGLSGCLCGPDWWGHREDHGGDRRGHEYHRHYLPMRGPIANPKPLYDGTGPDLKKQ